MSPASQEEFRAAVTFFAILICGVGGGMALAWLVGG